MVLLVKHPDGRDQERRYIIETVITDFLGLSVETSPHGETHYELAVRDLPGRLTICDVFLGSHAEWLSPSSLPIGPPSMMDVPPRFRSRTGEPTLPVFFGDARCPSVASETGEQLAVDVFGTAFFLLTRYEEAARAERDEYGRFPSRLSVQCVAGVEDRPLVNECVDLLWRCMKAMWPALERKRRRPQLHLSHDIDDVSVADRPAHQFVRSLGSDLLNRREPRLALKRCFSYLAPEHWPEAARCDPYNTFDFLMDAAECVGVTASFNFVPQTSGVRGDPLYSIRGVRAQNAIAKIRARGHEIGYHGSFRTMTDPTRTRDEVALLREVAGCEISGGRQHYLKWSNPVTWQSWSDAGLTYDSSLGFADRFGFRTGCCYDYPVFNLLTRRSLPLRERPLLIMEKAVLADSKNHAPFLEQSQRAIDRAASVGGDVSILWHNSTLTAASDRALFQALIDQAQSRIRYAA